MAHELLDQKTVPMKDYLDHVFKYHPPKGNQAERYGYIRSFAKQMAMMIASLCPPSREASLAQTKLEECVMWANASIARNESAVESSSSTAAPENQCSPDNGTCQAEKEQ